MSSKLQGFLQYRLGKFVPQKNLGLSGKMLRFASMQFCNEFLNDSEQKVVKANVREILIRNRKNNSN